MAAEFPGAVPDLLALLTDPLAFATFQRLTEEQQAALDTLGTNPQGASGTVASRLAALETQVAMTANTVLRGLRITPAALAPNTQLAVTADAAAVEGQMVLGVSVACDISVTGKNGLTHPRTANTYYYLWLGVNPTTGEHCVIADDSAARAGIDVSHISLAGFTAWRRIGSRRTDAAGLPGWVQATQTDGWVLFRSIQSNATIAAGANAWTTRNIDTAVPPTSRLALVSARRLVGGTIDGVVRIAEMGTGGATSRILTQGAVPIPNTQPVVLTAAQQYDWMSSEAVSVEHWVDGYYESL